MLGGADEGKTQKKKKEDNDLGHDIDLPISGRHSKSAKSYLLGR